MTEERLKEIKDSIDLKITGAKLQALKHAEQTFNEELELYNEVIRLREIIDKAIEYIKTQQILFVDYDIVIEQQLDNLLKMLNGEQE